MSWLDTLGDLAGTAVRWFGGSGTGATVAKIAGLIALQKVISKQIEKDVEVDMSKYQRSDYGTLSSGDTLSGIAEQLSMNNISQGGTRIQLNPSTTNKIPVLYGAATFGGDVFDARLVDNSQTLWIALALTEVTGTLLSDSSPSAYTLNEVFVDNQRIVFKSDGITLDYVIDTEGNRDNRWSGLVEVYFYANGRTNPQVPEYYTNAAVGNADDHMPGWTADHTMSNLVFALVKLKYSKEKELTNLPTFQFAITNTMSLPGDVLYDYMTNDRYGAGLEVSEISVS